MKKKIDSEKIKKIIKTILWGIGVVVCFLGSIAACVEEGVFIGIIFLLFTIVGGFAVYAIAIDPEPEPKTTFQVVHPSTIAQTDTNESQAIEKQTTTEQADQQATEQVVEQATEQEPIVEKPVRCPKCGSTQITAVQRKWSVMAGFMTNKVDRFCLKCKYKW